MNQKLRANSEDIKRARENQRQERDGKIRMAMKHRVREHTLEERNRRESMGNVVGKRQENSNSER